MKDLIRRSDALKAIANDGDEHWWYEERINEVPAVDAVEVVHAKWECIMDFGNGDCLGYCSNCHTEHKAENGAALKAGYRHCRWCGARMEGE